MQKNVCTAIKPITNVENKKKTQLYWKYPSAVFCNLEDWKEIYRDLVYSIIVCQEPAGE